MDSTLSVVVHDEQDPFLAVDESVLKLKELIHVTMTGCQACLIDEYGNGEKSLPTSREMDDENWKDAFLEIVESTKIKTYKEVNEYFYVQHFLES